MESTWLPVIWPPLKAQKRLVAMVHCQGHQVTSEQLQEGKPHPAEVTIAWRHCPSWSSCHTGTPSSVCLSEAGKETAAPSTLLHVSTSNRTSPLDLKHGT